MLGAGRKIPLRNPTRGAGLSGVSRKEIDEI